MAQSPEKSDAAKREEEVLAFWERERIFEKTLEKESPKGDFVFYEGPPTANGKPGIHHLESRAFKDTIPRYKTMRGYRVLRRAGWDTHGLPVELEVEKEFGFSGKKDIEAYGIATFNKKCRESVYRYIGLWSKFTKRIGYWVDEAKAYFTLDASYMEVLWHLFAHIAKSGRLYKDYKIVPWCPRCGTALSSHELAQGYEDVKDLTVTAKFKVKNPEKIGLSGDVFLLAWTTTPWTLPGNVALAVGESIQYSVIDQQGEARNQKFIVAQARQGAVVGNLLVIDKTVTGAELVGLEYEPLYDYAEKLAPESEKPKFAKAFQVYPADFVTTEDGTGIVHTAVMYGQDDFELGTKIGLPKVHLVSPDGKFIEGTSALAGKSVVDEETAIDIIKDLAARNLLFAKEKHEHTYPFCWRCKTRLIYYARDSWYFRMHDLRDTLVAENRTIHWEPEYIRDGRMGEWLAGAKEWAISRERYWGTPLPVWRSADGEEQLVIGSIDELKRHTKTSGNTYFFMRHGEAENNVLLVASSSDAVEKQHHLTDAGRADVEAHAKRLRGVDLVVHSPLVRTTETAELVAKILGLSKDQVRADERLRELSAGAFDGKPLDDYRASFSSLDERFEKAPHGGETLDEVRRRVGDFLYELEATQEGKRILIISHGDVLWMLRLVASGLPKELTSTLPYPKRGLIEELAFVPLPHNEDYELDLHRPAIDDVVLVSEKGTELRRVPEVMDVWFDSGAMPFAQSAKERGGEPLDRFLASVAYPADFISEAIDQTRGWFYTLLAIGVLMGRRAPYKNVISLGHLLDAEGKKMSKSKGNVIDPWVAMDKWGVDTLRFWMYSVSSAGDSKNYDEKTVKEAARTLSWFENSAKFYGLFKDGAQRGGTETVLDRWMRARAASAIGDVTGALDRYDLFSATRSLAALFEDLSQWYVRRIRGRARAGDAAALTTLRYALRISALLLAPFAPFLAEEVFRTVRADTDPMSVHLAAWPSGGRPRAFAFWRRGVDTKLLSDMARVRAIASQAHELRQKALIKVRQPLAQLSIQDNLPAELAQVLAEEVNVKRVACLEPATMLDTELTPALIKEGDEREMARAVAEARKAEELSPKESAHAEVHPEGKHTVELSTGTTRFDLVRDAT
ncbi:MAG TPA: class I tRNA ligase family protein [Candidatus Paceibacterota bacterium]|nr:class I tRNA ligase family protein [Candidatus Paceibacterota bacterium]